MLGCPLSHEVWPAVVTLVRAPECLLCTQAPSASDVANFYVGLTVLHAF